MKNIRNSFNVSEKLSDKCKIEIKQKEELYYLA